MEELLKMLFPRVTFSDEELWKLEELLDAYIDKRIEDRLDQEFSRGQYRSDW